jgi:ribonuclease P protein component
MNQEGYVSKDRRNRTTLPKNERLKGKQVFAAVFSRGKRISRGNLTIVYLPAEQPSAGFIASKHIGGAVKRNRVKRILREAYRMNKDLFTGLIVVLYARGPLERDDVIAAFKKFMEER